MDQSKTKQDHISSQIKDSLLSYAEPDRVALLKKYFKTGPGEYAEGDQFIGIRVPNVRKVARQFRSELTPTIIDEFMSSEWHEHRLFACVSLVTLYKQHKRQHQHKPIVVQYLTHLRSGYINNWDLVDATAYHILGDYLLDKPRDMLYALTDTGHLWSQRAAIVACMAFAKKGDGKDITAISSAMLNHPHDLIHKACGWILRELGIADKSQLIHFLDQHTPSMPRTMLRYAIEKFDPQERKYYLSL